MLTVISVYNEARLYCKIDNSSSWLTESLFPWQFFDKIKALLKTFRPHILAILQVFLLNGLKRISQESRIRHKVLWDGFGAKLLLLLFVCQERWLSFSLWFRLSYSLKKIFRHPLHPIIAQHFHCSVNCLCDPANLQVLWWPGRLKILTNKGHCWGLRGRSAEAPWRSFKLLLLCMERRRKAQDTLEELGLP